MTTVIPFMPSNVITPTIHLTLDGQDCKMVITWNISAQRYYINIYGSDGIWIVTVPLVQTSPSRAIANASYDMLRRVMTVKLVDPIYFPVPLGANLTPPGTIADYTLENFDPPLLNRKWRSLHIDDVTFSFSLADNPGQIKVYGSVARYVDMIGGLFTTSKLIYRNGAFEVSP